MAAKSARTRPAHGLVYKRTKTMPFAHCGEKQHGRSLRLPNLTRLAAWHSFLSRRQKRQRVRRRVGTASLGEVRRVRFSRQEWDFFLFEATAKHVGRTVAYSTNMADSTASQRWRWRFKSIEFSVKRRPQYGRLDWMPLRRPQERPGSPQPPHLPETPHAAPPPLPFRLPPAASN